MILRTFQRIQWLKLSAADTACMHAEAQLYCFLSLFNLFIYLSETKATIMSATGQAERIRPLKIYRFSLQVKLTQCVSICTLG